MVHMQLLLRCVTSVFYALSATEFLFLQWHKKWQRLPTGMKHSPLCHFAFGPERFKHRTLSGSLTLTNGCLFVFLFIYFYFIDVTAEVCVCAHVATGFILREEFSVLFASSFDFRNT